MNIKKEPVPVLALQPEQTPPSLNGIEEDRIEDAEVEDVMESEEPSNTYEVVLPILPRHFRAESALETSILKPKKPKFPSARHENKKNGIPSLLKVLTESGSVSCARCKTRLGRPSTTTAVSHVSRCLDIKPWACSACRLRSTQKSTVQRHVSGHPSFSTAAPTLINGEENEMAGENGGSEVVDATAGNNNEKKMLVTGCTGFIGFHLCYRLFKEGWNVVGWDTESVHYPTTTIRHHRKEKLLKEAPPSFTYKDVNIESLSEVENGWEAGITVVVHLAARAGVRESLTDPAPYITTNLLGHFHVLDKARREKVEQFLYASSSSVYGSDSSIPFKETDPCNQPMSLYAATKKADELMCFSYSHLYGLQTTGLRFFTVYGPWGRPDMAVYDFTDRIRLGKPITVFNHGNNRRAFTFVDDVVSGIVACVRRPSNLTPPYRVYNIGSGEMVTTHRLIQLIETHLEKKAKIEYTGPIACDMLETGADLSRLEKDVDYKPAVTIDTGIAAFIAWYREFYDLTT